MFYEHISIDQKPTWLRLFFNLKLTISIQHAFRHSLECIQARHIYTTVVRRETHVEVSYGAPKNVYI